jgi:hypothetical protein
MPFQKDKLLGLSETPDRKDGVFDKWLEQEDTVAFLEGNAREDELVIYASLSPANPTSAPPRTVSRMAPAPVRMR